MVVIEFLGEEGVTPSRHLRGRRGRGWREGGGWSGEREGGREGGREGWREGGGWSGGRVKGGRGGRGGREGREGEDEIKYKVEQVHLILITNADRRSTQTGRQHALPHVN